MGFNMFEFSCDLDVWVQPAGLYFGKILCFVSADERVCLSSVFGLHPLVRETSNLTMFSSHSDCQLSITRQRKRVTVWMHRSSRCSSLQVSSGCGSSWWPLLLLSLHLQPEATVWLQPPAQSCRLQVSTGSSPEPALLRYITPHLPGNGCS